MKWLISKKEFAPGKRFKDFSGKDFSIPNADGIVTLKKHNPLIDESFVIYDDDDRLNDAIMDKSKFNEWKTYPLEGTFKEKQKINYECFCGGYLAFYNKGISSEGKGGDPGKPVIDRLLYLKWIDEDKQTGTQASVQLIISKPPKGDSYTKSIQDLIKFYADSATADTQEDPDPPPAPPPPPDA